MDDDIFKVMRDLARSEAEAREKGKKQRGPRSRLVDAIFVMLLSRPMKSSEIAGLLGYDSRYIASYLSYWKTRGYVEYESGYWYLTPLGEEYARNVVEKEINDRFNEFAAIAQRILSSLHISGARKSKKGVPERGGAGVSLPFIAGNIASPGSKRQKRQAIAECALQSLSGEDLTSDELEVVKVLLEHYARWGTSYMYVDQLQEALQADYEWLVRTLRELQTKGIVYLYRDPRLGLRVGFSKSMRQVLEACGASK